MNTINTLSVSERDSYIYGFLHIGNDINTMYHDILDECGDIIINNKSVAKKLRKAMRIFYNIAQSMQEDAFIITPV